MHKGESPRERQMRFRKIISSILKRLGASLVIAGFILLFNLISRCDYEILAEGPKVQYCNEQFIIYMGIVILGIISYKIPYKLYPSNNSQK